jgi:hypothetical protein
MAGLAPRVTLASRVGARVVAAALALLASSAGPVTARAASAARPPGERGGERASSADARETWPRPTNRREALARQRRLQAQRAQGGAWRGTSFRSSRHRMPAASPRS